WESVAGASIVDLVAPEQRGMWREHHQRICQGESLTWEFAIIGLNGTCRQMETHAVPIRLADGSVGQLAITRDMTARKNAEHDLQRANDALKEKISENTRDLGSALAQLQESERRFQLLVSGVTDYAIYMLDPMGVVVSWNTGAQRIK